MGLGILDTLRGWWPVWGSGETAPTPSRTFVGATTGRRAGDMPSWRVDPQELLWALPTLRAHAKWLARNSSVAAAATRDLPLQVVDTGILPAVTDPRWLAWAGDAAQCDTCGHQSLVGLQWQMMRAVMITGECFVVRRRRMADTGPVPMALDVLDGDALGGGLDAAEGIERDNVGRPTGYWFGPEAMPHRIGAEDVIHIYDRTEPGLRRGVSWLAPVVMGLSQYRSYQDATLAAKELAGRMALLVSDPDGSSSALATSADPEEDYPPELQPGAVIRVRPGEHVESVDPPANRDLEAYARITMSDIASGLGMTVEDLTGDYRGMPFSSAKKSQMTQWRRVRGWRQRLLLPAMQRVEAWAREAADVGTGGSAWGAPETWASPALPMLDPEREGRAAMQQVRSGVRLLSEVVRDRGHEPESYFRAMAAEREMLASLGLVLDSMPEQTTQAGQIQQQQTAGAAPAPQEATA